VLGGAELRQYAGTHLFEEPGALEQVAELAIDWFDRHLAAPEAVEPAPQEARVYATREEAGRMLARRLSSYRQPNVVVLGIPRGGLPVAREVADALDAPLDVIVVRKLGAPGQPELGIGAVVDGDQPRAIFNQDIIEQLDVEDEYIKRPGCWSGLDLNFRDPSSLRRIFDYRAGSVMGTGLGIPRKPEVTVV
jgi:putative phosphoribosyl transferase